MEFNEAYLKWTFVSSETHNQTTLLKAFSDTNILGQILCVWIEPTTWEKEEGRSYDEASALAVVSRNELYTIKIAIREDPQELEELRASDTKVPAYNLKQPESPVSFPFKWQVFLTMMGFISWRI